LFQDAILTPLRKLYFPPLVTLSSPSQHTVFSLIVIDATNPLTYHTLSFLFFSLTNSSSTPDLTDLTEILAKVTKYVRSQPSFYSAQSSYQKIPFFLCFSHGIDFSLLQCNVIVLTWNWTV
jgi:hypothetical protein